MKNSIGKIGENFKIISGILSSCETEEQVNGALDRMVNSVDIFYETRDEYEELFPKDPSDIEGKINLIILKRNLRKV